MYPKWVEATSYAKNDAATVSKFLQKNIFTRFGTPRALISDEGTPFVNKLVSKLLIKYNVHHKVVTAYHPQTNGQEEISNRELKTILKKVVNSSRKTERRSWRRHCGHIEQHSKRLSECRCTPLSSERHATCPKN